MVRDWHCPRDRPLGSSESEHTYEACYQMWRYTAPAIHGLHAAALSVWVAAGNTNAVCLFKTPCSRGTRAAQRRKPGQEPLWDGARGAFIDCTAEGFLRGAPPAPTLTGQW